MIKGNLHSIETLGLFDGPGIRTIFFFKGCPLKCQYCHNPDTQSTEIHKEYSVEELVKIAKKYKSYYKRSGGGVTLSGGEPLLQGEFVLKLIKALKSEDIHVTLDTSGIGDTNYISEIIKNVDLILLDIKHFDSVSHKRLVGTSLTGVKSFLEKLRHNKTPLWVRHVMLPGFTDTEEHMDKLFTITKNIHQLIEKFEILPYHKLGLSKYEEMGLDYALENLMEMDKEVAGAFEEAINLRLSERKRIGKRAI